MNRRDFDQSEWMHDIEQRSRAIPINTEHAFAPSVFSLEEKFFLYPSQKNPWSSLNATIDAFRPRTVLTFLPYLLQLNQQIFRTLHQARIPEISMPPGNPEAALEIVRGLGSEGIVTDAQGALALQNSADAEKLASLSFWHVIIPVQTPVLRFSARVGIVCRDLHLFPGVSIAHQCAALAQLNTASYHPTAGFEWTCKDEALLVRSVDARPVPIPLFPVSRGSMRTETPCACGSDIILEFYE